MIFLDERLYAFDNVCAFDRFAGDFYVSLVRWILCPLATVAWSDGGGA